MLISNRYLMKEQDQYSIAPTRNMEGIQQNYSNDAQKMRAKSAQLRLAAKRRAERDARQRAALEQVPPEHRI